MPGDDIRRVDWKLFARTDRYYIKEYEADSNSNFAVLLDVSKSMGFGSRGITKLDYGKMLAGCLTYLVHRQRDRVGFVAFDDDIVEHVPPSAKHMDTVLHVLDRLKPAKPGNLRAPLHKIAEHFGRRGVLVLVSDFYEDPDAVLEAVGPLRFRGHDMIVFHVLDPAEIEFYVHRAVRRSKISRAASRFRSSRRRWPSSIASWCRRTSTALRRTVLRAAVDYALHQHVVAARPRAVQYLTCDAARCRACDDRAEATVMSFLTPLFLVAPGRARHSGDAAPDPARAEARRRSSRR